MHHHWWRLSAHSHSISGAGLLCQSILPCRRCSRRVYADDKVMFEHLVGQGDQFRLTELGDLNGGSRIQSGGGARIGPFSPWRTARPAQMR